MKCETCGGSIIQELGTSQEENRLKCMACGRYVIERPAREREKIMDTKMKRCTKCGIEKPATLEFFSTNNSCPDRLERWCKTCKAKAQKDHRERMLAKSKPDPKPQRKIVRRGASPSPAPMISASPADIVIALRKGMAAEIVAMINERYGL